MVFIGGQYYPISGISLPALPKSADRNAPRSILVDGLGHTEDLIGENSIPKGANGRMRI
jgi:hypothetical protein